MISVLEATALIEKNLITPRLCEAQLLHAHGKVLAEDILAERHGPPFDRVAMDGVAINSKSFETGARLFPIKGVAKAGSAQLTLSDTLHCIEVMTGAMLPIGTDAVVPYEMISISEGGANLNQVKSVTKMQNVHLCGSDFKKGDLLLKSGTRILSPEIAVIASNGYHKVKVLKDPSIAIVSTGDELVEVDADVLPHQIRRSNAYAIKAELLLHNINEVSLFHMSDQSEGLTKLLTDLVSRFDILILSGGVSMGKFDFVPSTLHAIGVLEIFHKINQKPGKPLWFGVKEKKTMVFGLPGNPVSALIDLRRYVIPAIGKIYNNPLLGASHVVLGVDTNFKKPMSYFVPVMVHFDGPMMVAVSKETNGSGDYNALSGSAGFIEFPPDQTIFHKGQQVLFYPWGR